MVGHLQGAQLMKFRRPLHKRVKTWRQGQTRALLDRVK